MTKLLPAWASRTAGRDPRRSVDHVFNVELARRKGHYVPDPNSHASQPHPQTRLELSSGDALGGDVQLVPDLEDARTRLERISTITGINGSMREAVGSLAEIVQVAEARIRKIWRCCEEMCQRYAKDE